ncbi:MAG: CesT family type III secretion system chaperone [Deltaproteobacteria bacterium]|nr:CesT family type III secretion system chaperone [Deltaproteobacteria bacterium]MBQ6669017.1 CesT family type III secretion system chaperone [Deltaproteobacteria bacterium]
MLERELAEFGRRLGMANLAFHENGMAVLEIESLGRLCLEQDGDDLLIYMTASVPESDREAPRRVLERCDYRYAHPFTLVGGLYKSRIMLLVRLPQQRISAVQIENAARFLAEELHSLVKG